MPGVALGSMHAGPCQTHGSCVLITTTLLAGTEMEVVTAVRIPYAAASELFWSHKVALRYYNSHALVNIAFKVGSDQHIDGTVLVHGTHCDQQCVRDMGT